MTSLDLCVLHRMIANSNATGVGPSENQKRNEAELVYYSVESGSGCWNNEDIHIYVKTNETKHREE